MPAQRIDTCPRRTLIKWLVVYSPLKPPPGKIQTAPEMMTTAPTSWSADLAQVEQLMDPAGRGLHDDIGTIRLKAYEPPPRW